MSSSDESITDDTEEFIEPKRRRIEPIALRLVSPPADDPLISWIDKYSPRTLSELCLHPRKLSDVRKVMTSMVNGDKNAPKVLILHGPSGCSKSTSVKLLASDIIKSRTSSLVEYSESTLFPEFLHDAKYRVGSNKCVILVEEYPNVFHEQTHQIFKDSLWEWIHTDEPLPPLVLCVSEVEHQNDQDNRREFFNIHNNWTVDTLVGKRIANHSQVAKIKFNPIAVTYIKKTLSKLIQLESKHVFSKIPKQESGEFTDLVAKCGDIRSSIANLQFWSTMRSKLPSKDEKLMSLYSMGKETQLNLFHAIGKIVYGLSNNAAPREGDVDETSEDEYSPDYFTILDVLSTYPSNNLLQLSLLENYGVFNNDGFDVEQAANIVDNLSLSDVLGSDSGEGANKEIGIRGVRSVLGLIGTHQTTSRAANRAANQIKFPKHFKIIREFNRVTLEIRDYQRYIRHGASFQDLNLLYGFYEPRIYNSIKWKRKNVVPLTRMGYNRLGGKFREIYPTEGLPVADLDEEEEEEKLRAAASDQFKVEIREHMNAESGQASDSESELSDEIEDSDGDFDDSIGFMELDNMISQTKNQLQAPAATGDSDGNSDSDVFLSDEELDELLRKRNL